MRLKKASANQLSHSDIVRVLDAEEENLSEDICSKLRQNRSNAIDHARIIDKRHYARETFGWILATAASISIVVFLFNHQDAIDTTTVAKINPAMTEGISKTKGFVSEVDGDAEKNGNAAEFRTLDENAQKEEAEDLEIYEWLYNNYG
ncbi:MAG: Unknown protein [uncultured Thiotrichaceae bacterium]|uniref:Uncharacterized protein n=1 Tax=uncultured Thiotrichaceae bacterium TaxID=298394 RepID=A0A6S6U4J4_9GAMM|nr:MAG: Unknown protein [uncultured Thiotrichaceae bacterium]